MLNKLLDGSGSLPLGSILGIPIRLHVTFFVVLGLQLLGSLAYGGWWVLLWFLLLGPVLLLTVLLHELGHCLAARSVGGSAEGVLLWPLGGLAFIGHTAGPKADMWVAVAGPLTHLPQVAAWLLLLLPAYHASTGSWAITLAMPYPDPAHLFHALCVGAIIINISLAVFNLCVPAYPLDGGRLLVDGLLAAGVAPRVAATVTIAAAVPLACAIAVYGIIVFQMVTIMVRAAVLDVCLFPAPALPLAARGRASLAPPLRRQLRRQRRRRRRRRRCRRRRRRHQRRAVLQVRHGGRLRPGVSRVHAGLSAGSVHEFCGVAALGVGVAGSPRAPATAATAAAAGRHRQQR